MVIGRDATKTERVVTELRAATGNEQVSLALADMSDLGSVRELAAGLLRDHPRLDALFHNAGALTKERTKTADGIELTVAGQVVGPFLLTWLLQERLRASAPARAITMSSGGMYTATLEVTALEMSAADYNGTRQYALAKRAQVTLNEMWADRFPDRSVVFHAVHPGWVDTPGIVEALPTFRRVVGPLLRTPLEGADTMVWLGADDAEPLATSGAFWLDRRVRAIHRLPSTARSDTPGRRRDLWDRVVAKSGCETP